MSGNQLRALGRLVAVGTMLWATSYSHAAADAVAGAASAKAGPPMGIGIAYFFGFGAGLVIFGATLALKMRKDHLARNGK